MKSDIENKTCCGSDRPLTKSPDKRAKAVSPSMLVPHPDHGAQIIRLNRVVGQLNGVKRMIEDRRYCPEILTQIRAARAALKSVELLVLGTHLRHCVAEATRAEDPEIANMKIEELVALLEQY